MHASTNTFPCKTNRRLWNVLFECGFGTVVSIYVILNYY